MTDMELIEWLTQRARYEVGTGQRDLLAAAERIRVLGEFKQTWDAEMLKANVWRTDCGCRRTFEVMNNAARAAVEGAR